MTFFSSRFWIWVDENPHSFNPDSVSSPNAGAFLGMAGGVRLNLGTGAGCTTPSMVTKLFRLLLWGCAGAYSKESTGAKQTSDPSKISHHCARVLVLKIRSNFSCMIGHWVLSIWGGNWSGLNPSFSKSRA